MLEFMKALKTAASGMQAQANRQRLISENVANADTPGYRRKLATFATELDRQTGAPTVKMGRVTLDQSELKKVYDPSHPLADDTGSLRMSNVNLITEIADARQANRTYSANLNMFDQTRRMYASVLDLLRR
ncbi:MAG: flagellar basal body rod protein FlgC [Pseudomonadota bacterium]